MARAIDLCGPNDKYFLATFVTKQGHTEVMIGHTRSGLDHLGFAISTCHEMGWVAGELMALAGIVPGRIDLGEYPEALDNAQKARSLAVNLRISPLFNSAAWSILIMSQVSLGQWDVAQRTVDEGISSDSILYRSPYFLSTACEASVLRGDWEQALQHAKVAHTGDTWIEYRSYCWGITPRWAETLALLKGGEIEMVRGKIARLEQERIHDNLRLRVSYLRCKALLEEWESQAEQALDSLKEALAIAEKLDLPHEQWQLGGELARIVFVRGNLDGAAQLRNQALQITLALANKIPDEAMRQTFLESSSHRIHSSWFL